MTQWTQLGPRERELLAVLRRTDAPSRPATCSTRSVATATMSRTRRSSGPSTGSSRRGSSSANRSGTGGGTRHRYRFDVEAARERLVPEFADELRTVLGEPAIERLARTVRTERDGGDEADATTQQ